MHKLSHLTFLECTFPLSIDYEPEAESRELIAVQGPSLSLLVAGDHLDFVSLHHLVPSVPAIRHRYHVALVRVDHLRQVLGVDGHLESEGLRNIGVDIDDIVGVYALRVPVSHPIKRVFHELLRVLSDPVFLPLAQVILPSVNIGQPVAQLFFR